MEKGKSKFTVVRTWKTEFFLYYSSLRIVFFSIWTAVNLLLPHPVYDLIQKCYPSLPLKKPYEAVKIWLFLFTCCDVRAQRDEMTPLVPARKSRSWDQKQTLAGLLGQGCTERVEEGKMGEERELGRGRPKDKCKRFRRSSTLSLCIMPICLSTSVTVILPPTLLFFLEAWSPTKQKLELKNPGHRWGPEAALGYWREGLHLPPHPTTSLAVRTHL